MHRQNAFLDTPHGQVHYWTVGKGPPMLMLHQAAQSSTECAALAQHLLDQFTVISFDYPGHGQSQDPAVELGVEEFSQIAIDLLDELQVDETHVVGHHSGGIVAGNLAACHPQRFASATLSGIGIRTEDSVNAVLERPMTRDLPLDRSGDFLRHTWNAYRQLSSPGTEAATTMQFFVEGLAARARPFDAHIPVIQFDRDPVFATIRIPTLLLVGEHDHFAELPQLLADKISGSKLRTIPDGGAFLFYEQPQHCAQTIKDFINQL